MRPGIAFPFGTRFGTYHHPFVSIQKLGTVHGSVRQGPPRYSGSAYGPRTRYVVRGTSATNRLSSICCSQDKLVYTAGAVVTYVSTST